jgi:hypothetical protein
MKSALPGTNISEVEVTNISKHGFWLLLKNRELFVPFSDFPWFKEATIAQLINVEWPGQHHLYWPDLDIDLAVESIEHPERFPLVSRIMPSWRSLDGAELAKRNPGSYGDKENEDRPRF